MQKSYTKKKREQNLYRFYNENERANKGRMPSTQSYDICIITQ